MECKLKHKNQMEIFSKHIGNLDRVLFRKKDLAPAIEREAIKRSLALRRFIAMKRTTSLGVLTILSKDSEVKNYICGSFQYQYPQGGSNIFGSR